MNAHSDDVSLTFNLIVLAGGKEIWMTRRDDQSTHCIDMPRQGEFQSTFSARAALSKIPNLNRTIGTTRNEPFVRRIEGYTAHPTQMTGNNCGEFPGCMPLRCGYLQQHRDKMGLKLSIFEDDRFRT